VEFENEAFILSTFDALGQYGMDYAAGSVFDEMVGEWADLRQGWEELTALEPEYTQHMMDSVITFNVVDIEAASKTVTYTAEMRGEVEVAGPIGLRFPILDFQEPIQLKFVSGGLDLFVMKNFLQDAPAFSPYPLPIRIRTDISRTTEDFTWLLAHESFHRFEQTAVALVPWFRQYLSESGLPHGERPSEIRANRYADRYYPR
jgi:hypothetical protein